MNRAEHVRWSKARAMYYVENDMFPEAVSSIMQDYSEHPDTSNSALLIGQMGMLEILCGADKERMRRFIEGCA